jgi:uridylate kinase
VIKLGGSLAESMRLSAILEVVGEARISLVVVPGGGAFADAVRRAQADFGFADAEAHRMALLAMHQTGLMLAALNQRLKPVETLAEIDDTLKVGQIPVWLPLKLTERDKRIVPNWSTTSDGLAARLAERLGRASVVLIKSCAIAPGSTLAGLTREGVIDPTFAEIVERAHLPWRVMGAGDEADLADLLQARARPAYGRRSVLCDAGRRTSAVRAIARRR